MECCQTTLPMNCYLSWLNNSGVICRQGVASSGQEREKDRKDEAVQDKVHKDDLKNVVEGVLWGGGKLAT